MGNWFPSGNAAIRTQAEKSGVLMLSEAGNHRVACCALPRWPSSLGRCPARDSLSDHPGDD